MLVAPLVVVALIIAIPLWPVALALLAALCVVTWMLERLCRLLRIPAFQGATARAWRRLVWLSRPFNWFDTPAIREPQDKPPA